MIDTIQNNFNYVLYKAWGVNCTTFQYACWKVIEVFLDKETASKITCSKDFIAPDFATHYHPSQLEKRFGGLAEQPTVFWPPCMPSNEFGEDPQY